jgi:methylated-DNA-[protein]-cysteine S-methyltransferase
MIQTHARPRAGTARVFHHTHPSPIGPLLLTSDGSSITRLQMAESNHPAKPTPGWIQDPAPFREAVRQLDEYFAGERRAFDLPLAPRGTAFQQKVWETLRKIPWGKTASYAEVARRVGSPKGMRAVGGANGRNPIAIIVPCHRVIAADGTLGGYGGGLHRKRFLLELEGVSLR